MVLQVKKNMVDEAFISKFLKNYLTDDIKARIKPYKADLGAGIGTKETRRTTAEICLWLTENGYWWATEVPILGKDRRADILCPEFYEAQVIEIYHSESQESINNKHSDYKKKGLVMKAVPAKPETAIQMLQCLK